MNLFQEYLLKFVGTPYKWGGDDPMEGFDCSGFAQESLQAWGADYPGDQTAQALHDFLAADHAGIVPACGALAFYGRTPGRVSHVAICITPELIVEAGGGGSRTNDEDDAARDNAYIRIRPLHNRKDLLAVYLPKYTIPF